MDDELTWKEFTDMVLGMLTVDASRDGTETFRDRYIRQGVILVQSLVEEFTLNHETLYYPSDLVVEGRASRGVKPPQSVIQDLFFIRIDTASGKCTRTGVDLYPWSKRFDLIKGSASLNGGRALTAIDNEGYTFYIYPEVRDCEMISMFWNGQKLDFRDDESVPFTEQMAMTVAELVKAKFARDSESDLAKYDSFSKSAMQSIPLLRANARERRALKGQ